MYGVYQKLVLYDEETTLSVAKIVAIVSYFIYSSFIAFSLLGCVSNNGWVADMLQQINDPFKVTLITLTPLIFYIYQRYVLKFKKSSRVLTGTLFIWFSVTAYSFSGIAWESNESEFDSKLFGLYKADNKFYADLGMQQLKLTDEAKIDSMKDELEADSLEYKLSCLKVKIDSVNNIKAKHTSSPKK